MACKIDYKCENNMCLQISICKLKKQAPHSNMRQQSTPKPFQHQNCWTLDANANANAFNHKFDVITNTF